MPTLENKYWPTFWCVESRAQTVLASLLRSQSLPHVNYRRYASHSGKSQPNRSLTLDLLVSFVIHICIRVRSVGFKFQFKIHDSDDLSLIPRFTLVLCRQSYDDEHLN